MDTTNAIKFFQNTQLNLGIINYLHTFSRKIIIFGL